jgi:tetratricopeptide (TPR) repeat protein
MRTSDERSHFSPLTLPLLAGAALLLLGHSFLTDPRFIEQLGDRAARAGDHAQAMACYRRAMQADPNGASAPCSLALELAATKDILQAQRTLEKNLQLHPLDAATNEALADLVVRSLGDIAYPKVQKYYETALRSDPTRAGAALGLSRIYLAQNRIVDAGRILVKPLGAHERNAALHLQMASILALVGQYDRASAEFNAGTARDPTNAEAYCAWGVTLIAAGKTEQLTRAEQVLRRALELQPDNPLYHLHLARALRGLVRMMEADRELSIALKKDIHCVPVYIEIASTLQQAHDEKGAENYLRLCVEINPTSVEARVALANFLTHAADPLRRNLWEAATLRQTCVNDATEPDAVLLLGAAQSWERVEQPDRSLALVNKALAWGKLHGMSPEDAETLLKYRQRYELALIPPLEGPPTFRSVEGRVVRDATDTPWPDVRQPSIESLLVKPTRLDQPPGPGSVFDPALYSGNAAAPPYQVGYRP